MPTIIVKKDPKQLRRDVRGAVLGVAAFIMTMNVVAVIVVMVALLVEHPELFDVNAYLSLSASPFSSAFDDASNLVLEMSEKYAGLASILGMLCGLPWFFLLRGKSFLTKDVSRVNSKVRIGTIAFLFVLILGVQAFMSLSQIAFEPLFNQSDISVTEGLDESMTALAT
jgi:hypothetical protein